MILCGVFLDAVVVEPECSPHTLDCDIKLTYQQAQYWFPESADELLKNGDVEDLNVGARGTTTFGVWNEFFEDDVVVIPYTIDTTNYDSRYIAVIGEAMNEIEELTKVVKFVPKSDLTSFSAGKHSIKFQSALFCNSYIGSVFEDQEINLMDYFSNGGRGCGFGTVIHEIMHALGFFHEQSRPDRDQFVTINFQNVRDDFVRNFETSVWIDSLGTEYDYGSLMHYGTHTFTKNGQATINANGNNIGQRDGMSSLDIIQIRLLYQCNSGPRNFASYTSTPCSNDCKCGLNDTGCNNSDESCKGSLVCSNNICVEAALTEAPTKALTEAPSEAPEIPCENDTSFRWRDSNKWTCAFFQRRTQRLMSKNCNNTKCRNRVRNNQCRRKAEYSGGNENSLIGDFCSKYCEFCTV